MQFMKRVLAVAAAGLIGAPVVAFGQSAPPVVVTYPAPPVQAGTAYYCGNPAGWYPSVRNCASEWVTYVQQQPVTYVRPAPPPPPASYAVPAPQTGIAYYCSAPAGWYPAIQSCSTSWMAYAQQPAVTYVVPAPAPAPMILVETPRIGPDAASAPTRSGVEP